MPVTLKTNSGGGSVTLNPGVGSSDTTLTLPNVTGTVLQSGTAVTAAQGGTGLTTVGTSGNVLTSNGTIWVSSAAASPTALSTASGSAPSYSARAWVNFDGTTGTVRSSGNVTSVTYNGTGDYTVNFTSSMPDVNYSVVAGQLDSGNGRGFGVYDARVTAPGTYQLTGSVRMRCAAASTDPLNVTNASVAVFR